MKKIVLIFFVFQFIVLSCFAQTINEGFEGSFPPNGWTKQNVGSGIGWNRTTVGTTPIPNLIGGSVIACPNGLTGMAYCTYATGAILPDTISNQWLITPLITNVGSNFSLNFWLAKYGIYNENIQVLVSTSGSQVSDFTDTISTLNRNETDSGWVFYNFSLSDYSNQNIFIAFREFVGNVYFEGAFISLDNVVVGPSSSINDITAENNTISVYPNPAKDFITVNSIATIKSVKVYNTVGQVVIEKLVKDNVAKIAVSELKSGVYFVATETEKGIVTKKINVL